MSRIDKDWRMRVPIAYLIVLMYYKVSTDKAKIIFIARIKFILVKFKVFFSNKNQSANRSNQMIKIILNDFEVVILDLY